MYDLKINADTCFSFMVSFQTIEEAVEYYKNWRDEQMAEFGNLFGPDAIGEISIWEETTKKFLVSWNGKVLTEV